MLMDQNFIRIIGRFLFSALSFPIRFSQTAKPGPKRLVAWIPKPGASAGISGTLLALLTTPLISITLCSMIYFGRGILSRAIMSSNGAYVENLRPLTE